MDYRCAVIQAALVPERCADNKDREELSGLFNELIDRALNRVEQCILKQQILDRVGRQAKFGKQRDRRFLFIGLLSEAKRFGKIVENAYNPRTRYTGSNTDKIVCIKRIKLRSHTSGL